MKQVFYESFLRDLSKIKDPAIADSINDLIVITSKADYLSQIPHIKKLKGHRSAYRIRLKHYRIGIIVVDDVIHFSAVDHRKDIYRKFP